MLKIYGGRGPRRLSAIATTAASCDTMSRIVTRAFHRPLQCVSYSHCVPVCKRWSGQLGIRTQSVVHVSIQTPQSGAKKINGRLLLAKYKQADDILDDLN